MANVAEINLQELDPVVAQEVVIDYLISYRELSRQLLCAREQEELWRKRSVLTQEAGDLELKKRTDSRLLEARAKREDLSREYSDLSETIDSLKSSLRKLREAPESSISYANQLLGDLQSVTREQDLEAEEFRDLQTEEELHQLKRTLEAES